MAHTIWTYDNTNEDDWDIEDMIEEYEINGLDPDDITDEDFRRWIEETNQSYLEDERINLGDIEYANGILVIGNLGLWNGRKGGYKIIESGKVSDCLEIEDGRNLYEWHVTDEGEFCGTEAHHDGTNYYWYRAIKDDVDREDLEDLLDRIGDVTNPAYADEIAALTKPIGFDIAEYFGWELKKEA